LGHGAFSGRRAHACRRTAHAWRSFCKSIRVGAGQTIELFSNDDVEVWDGARRVIVL